MKTHTREKPHPPSVPHNQVKGIISVEAKNINGWRCSYVSKPAETRIDKRRKQLMRQSQNRPVGADRLPEATFGSTAEEKKEACEKRRIARQKKVPGNKEAQALEGWSGMASEEKGMAFWTRAVAGALKGAGAM
eukprot:10072567-Prorocentrum_lima.AAC.1